MARAKLEETKHMLNRRHLIIGAASIAALPPTIGGAQTPDLTVNGYSVHPEDAKQRMVFTPRILRMPAGSTVNFVLSNPTHNTQTTPGMLPDGAQPWRSGFGQPIAVTLTTPGYYGYHCLPHRALGMVGLIIVEGDGVEANLAAAKTVKHPGRAGKVWDAIWQEIKTA